MMELQKHCSLKGFPLLKYINKRFLRRLYVKYSFLINFRESEILRMRYGFDDGIAKTLDEIGERFQVTRERVRQIEAKVTRKLKSSKQRELLEQEHGTLIDITNSNVSK